MTNKLARAGLQWSLGLLLIYECARLLFYSGAMHLHIPHALLMLIAAAELLGAILFLIPLTVKAGGRLLLATFLTAAVVHLLHGQPDIGYLVIYAFAVLVVIT
jgi:uncharacterized membrane protein YphA (DoxX/SURF4 family)